MAEAQYTAMDMAAGEKGCHRSRERAGSVSATSRGYFLLLTSSKAASKARAARPKAAAASAWACRKFP